MSSFAIVTMVVGLYLAINLAVGLWPARKSTRTVQGYVAGDRGFGTVLMYFVTGSAVFSAFAFLGGPGWAFSRGMAALYITAYGVLGIFPWYFMGVYAARAGRRHEFVTQAGMLGFRYQHRGVAAVAGAGPRNRWCRCLLRHSTHRRRGHRSACHRRHRR